MDVLGYSGISKAHSERYITVYYKLVNPNYRSEKVQTWINTSYIYIYTHMTYVFIHA